MFTSTHLSGTPLALQQPTETRTASRPATARTACAAGVGGHSIASIMARHGMNVPAPLGVIVEHLDAQIGTWQMSIDEGASWHTVRTDLINRPGNRGLALEPAARLRVLPLPGSTRQGARMVLHAAQRALGDGNGCYQNYPPATGATAPRASPWCWTWTPSTAAHPQRARPAHATSGPWPR